MGGASIPEAIGRYRVIRRMATGATTDVLLATSGDDRVVVKILLEPFAKNERFAATFERAAAAHARLVHPAIVEVRELVAFERRPAMVVEHVDGAPLARVRGMLKAVGYELDDTASIHLAAEVFGAVAVAHSSRDDMGALAPVIHRYLNPGNVLLGWDGAVKLSDVGLPQPIHADRPTEIAKGTDGYMAPEQVTSDEPTCACDVYAAGIVLWELLTKTRAFRRTKRRLETWRAMAEPHLPSIDTLRPDLDARVRDALRAALDRNPETRTITAREVTAALRSVVSHEEGHERLAKLMAMVRHEPTPLLSDAPPPMTAVDPFSGRPVAPMPGPSAGVAATALAHSPAPAVTEPHSSTVLAAKAMPAPAPPKPPSSAKIAAAKPAALPFAALAAATTHRPNTTPAISPQPIVLAAVDTPPSIGVEPTAMAVPEVPAPAATPPPASPPEESANSGLSLQDTIAEEEAVHAPVPRKSGGVAPVAVAGMLVLLAVGGGAYALHARKADVAPSTAHEVAEAKAHSQRALAIPTSTSSNATPTAAPAPAPAAPSETVSAVATASAAPSIPSDQGLLDTTGLQRGHRIFVDGRSVGETPKNVLVPCGAHKVKIGSSGRPRSVDVPCGAATPLER